MESGSGNERLLVNIIAYSLVGLLLLLAGIGLKVGQKGIKRLANTPWFNTQEKASRNLIVLFMSAVVLGMIIIYFTTQP